MTEPGQDPQAPGEAWMRGELASRDYFAMARRGILHNRRRPGIWQWIKQVVKRRTP